MPKETKTKYINFRIDIDTETKIEWLCAQTERNRSDLLRRLVDHEFAKLQQIQAEKPLTTPIRS